MLHCPFFCFFFFFNDTATTEIYTLSLHDALPILGRRRQDNVPYVPQIKYHQDLDDTKAVQDWVLGSVLPVASRIRSEEHTSELQSQSNLVCRLLLEKKKNEKDRLIEQNHEHIDDA